ncbi:anthranilate synthase component I [Actinobacillus succinogenes]|uniref:Anthranilate synthase component 1 n=1 Tax=Actinobacillus succinogenes (strain ATCC 55618 / DSM 22257 / CCUG 43843 / 130Z) TaxID=339671 RepID=A6VNT5_ACTSZ|nr:anthranilate synthase component I [Actinobacillus succinogenes]ABR74632.1 anthranilate synthase component I [Actinobacillus succinogenes 130Z]PHI40943.1 anthranilate synthase component I [Actinobacillus succinogenes]
MFQPYIQVFSQPVEYHSDLASVFTTLCAGNTNSLLLESAEISSKNSLKSLLLVNAAVKICCTGQTVTFKALTDNGAAVLIHLRDKLSQLAQLTQINAHELIATFAPLEQNLDEDTKLQAATVFDGLRVVNNLYAHSQTPIFLGGLFAYDLVANFIPMDGIALQDDGLNCPDYVFYLAENLLCFNHPTQQATLQTFCFSSKEYAVLQQNALKISRKMQHLQPVPAVVPAGTEVETNIEDEKFKAIITELKQHIYLGDVFQIVPSRRFSLPCPNSLATYRNLKHNNPSPYMFYMQDDEFVLFGASPESALKFNADNRELEIYPIAGSRPRGFDAQGNIDPELDARLELEMRLDHKELAEHLMLVDLARNDIARVCQSGTRQVKDLMQVDRYSHIMHLVSRVVGTLRPELDALHAYQACMNMGTLTGAPKIKAMQLIYQLEKQKRHSYGGAVGYLSSDGNFDTCIVIRSAFVQNGIAHVQAGCGEVLDSDPQMEADETRHKARAVLNTIIQTNRQA